MLFTNVLLAVALVGSSVALPSPGADPAACPFTGKRAVDVSDNLKNARLSDLHNSPLTAKRAAAPSAEETDLEGRDLVGGLLGGLIGGIWQPLTGVLQALDLPTPQPQGLAIIPAPGDKAHEYHAPGPTDVRGLCPTLNALANHGYISRTGITTFAEATNAVQTVYGFGLDISAVLSLLGLIAGGDLLSGKYSIGGPDSRVPHTLGATYGIDTHGRFEVDGSISRGDVYFGDNHSFNQTRWDQLVATSKKYEGKFNQETGYENRQFQYQQSKNTNPEFFASPVYLAVSAATRAFLYRGLANGTTQDNADYKNVASFYLDERIPDNWYRRGNTYYLANFLEDVVDYVINSPIELGQNNGVGDFAPLDGDIPTAPNDLICFVLGAVLSVTPQQGVAPIVGGLSDLLGAVVNQILQPIINVGGYKCDVSKYVTSAGSGSGIKNPSNATATNNTTSTSS